MKKQIYTSARLENSWYKALRDIIKYGTEIHEKEPFIEIRNLGIHYQNAFESECINYQKVFGFKFLDYMERVYSPAGDLETGRNYHALIYSHNNINQVHEVINILKKEPSSRSAIIVLSSPNAQKKPCVTEIAFSIRDDLLHMAVIFKSSDFAKKFIPDMIELSKIHKYISASLNVARGEVNSFILCVQVYAADLEKVNLLFNKFKKNTYFKTHSVVENWDKEADNWDRYVEDPNHYVNIENGYTRFLNFLNTEITPVKNMDALDSGSGTGIIANVLVNKGYRVKGIDISPKMIAHSRDKDKKTQYTLSNSLDIPHPDNSFDLVCSRGVLISHVGKKYVDLFLKEHGRVLKKGGIFIFDFITKFDKSETKKKRSKASMSFGRVSNLLKDNGLKVIKRSGDDNNRVNAILCKKI